MEKYSDNEYLKQQIMVSKHLFIYGQNTVERTQLLRGLEAAYPIRINEDSPMAIYLDEFSLPLVKSHSDVDELTQSRIALRYLNISIAYNVIDRIYKSTSFDQLQSRISELMQVVKRLCLGNKEKGVPNIDELLSLLKISRQFYVQYYEKLMIGKSDLPELCGGPISYIDLDPFMHYVKQTLGNNSYFGIIVDNQTDIPLISKRAINNIVTKRCTGDISMKVACDFRDWNTYYGLGDVRADIIHDYGDIDLDGNEKEFLGRVKMITYRDN